MKLDRNLKGSEGLDGLRDLDLLLVQIKSMLFLGCCRDLLGGNGAEYLAVLSRLHLDHDLAGREVLSCCLGIGQFLGRYLVLMRFLKSEFVFVSLRSLDAQFLGEYIVARISVAYLYTFTISPFLPSDLTSCNKITCMIYLSFRSGHTPYHQMSPASVISLIVALSISIACSIVIFSSWHPAIFRCPPPPILSMISCTLTSSMERALTNILP